MKMNELKMDVPYEKRLEELSERSHQILQRMYEIDNEIQRLRDEKLPLWKERNAIVEEMENICEKYNLDEYGKPKNDMKKY